MRITQSAQYLWAMHHPSTFKPNPFPHEAEGTASNHCYPIAVAMYNVSVLDLGTQLLIMVPLTFSS
jgi:hypothetical protein